MAAPDIPDEVRWFIDEYIASIQQLEVLFVLTSAPESDWSVEAIDERLGIGAVAVTNRLINLLVKGLVTESGSRPAVYRYRPRTEMIARAVEQAGESYRKNRRQVVQIIAAKTDNQLRNFSDSFRIFGDE